MKNFIKNCLKIVKNQFSIFDIFQKYSKLKFEFRNTKNRIELFEIIKN